MFFCWFALFMNQEAGLSTGRPKYLSRLGEAEDSRGKSETHKTGLQMVLGRSHDHHHHLRKEKKKKKKKTTLLYLMFQGRHRSWSCTSNPTQFSKYPWSTNKVPSTGVMVLGDTRESLVSCISLWGTESGQPLGKLLANTNLPAAWWGHCEGTLLAPGMPSTSCTSTWHLMTVSFGWTSEPEPCELQTHSNDEIIKDYSCFQPLCFCCVLQSNREHSPVLHTGFKEANLPTVIKEWALKPPLESWL